LPGNSGTTTQAKKKKSAPNTQTGGSPNKKPKIVPSSDPGFDFEIEGDEEDDDKIQNKIRLSKERGGLIIYLFIFYCY
jgi:hypothetical protein